MSDVSIPEISEDRKSIIALIDTKIEVMKIKELRAPGEELAHSRQCMEALRSEIEQGLDQ